MPAIDRAVFVTAEGTPGTEQTPPAATDAIDYHRWRIGPPGGQGKLERPVVRPYQDRIKAKAPHGRFWPHDFECEVKAATAAGTAPELKNILKAAGFEETINGGVSVVYELYDDPNSEANDFSVTIRKEMTDEGITVVSYGARVGGLVFESDVDGQLIVTGRAIGAYKAPTDQGAVTTATYNTGTPLVTLDPSTPIALQDGYVPIVRRLKLSVNNDVRTRPNQAAAAAGYHSWPALVVRDPMSPVELECLVELVDITAHDFFGKWLAGNVDGTARSVVWTAGSRKLTATLQQTQYRQPEMIEDNPNLVLVRINAYHNESTGDPALALSFT